MRVVLLRATHHHLRRGPRRTTDGMGKPSRKLAAASHSDTSDGAGLGDLAACGGRGEGSVESETGEPSHRGGGEERVRKLSTPDR